MQPYISPPPSQPKPQGPSGTALALGLVALLFGACGGGVLTLGIWLSDKGAERDDADWATAKTFLPACQAPSSSLDCDGIKRYVAAWPNGRHANEARAVLQASSARLQQLAHQERQLPEAPYIPPSQPWPTTTSTSAPKTPPGGGGGGGILCCDGTRSKTCMTRKKGCCSKHGGVCGD